MLSSKLNKTLLAGLVLAVTSAPVFAGDDDDDDNYEDRARVVAVTPQFERVNNPRQECRTEYQRESYYEPRHRSNTGAVIGGVSGGLIGSTIGRGNGRVAAAAVGAGIGAIVGDRVDNDRYPRGGYERVVDRPVERCVVVDNWQQVPAGYLVQYEYNGRGYTTVMDRDPGRYVPVRVGVRPNGYVSNVVFVTSHDDDYGWKKGKHRGRGHGHGKYKHRERGYW